MSRLKGCLDRFLFPPPPLMHCICFSPAVLLFTVELTESCCWTCNSGCWHFSHSETEKTDITDMQFETIKSFVFCSHLGSKSYEFIMSFLLFTWLLPLQQSCNILTKTQGILLINDTEAVIVCKIQLPFSILISGFEDLFCCLFQ